MKEFNEWNQQKQKTNNTSRIVKFKERDIFYIRMGKNIGFEQNGKGQKFARPIFILKKFNSQVFWGIPLTTKIKKGIYYHSFQLKNIQNQAIISQLKLFDSKRLLNKLGMIPLGDFSEIKQKIKDFL